jgi:hypothetical protein
LAFTRFGPLLLLACSASAEFRFLFILSGCCYSAAWQYPWHLQAVGGKGSRERLAATV